MDTKDKKVLMYVVCFWHNRNEAIYDNTFKHCNKCHHVYQTPEELRIEAANQVYSEFDENGKPIEGFEKKVWPEDITVEQITYCPLCGSDFNPE